MMSVCVYVCFVFIRRKKIGVVFLISIFTCIDGFVCHTHAHQGRKMMMLVVVARIFSFCFSCPQNIHNFSAHSTFFYHRSEFYYFFFLVSGFLSSSSSFDYNIGRHKKIYMTVSNEIFFFFVCFWFIHLVFVVADDLQIKFHHIKLNHRKICLVSCSLFPFFFVMGGKGEDNGR